MHRRPPSENAVLLLLLLALGGCIRTVGRGPDLGDCANPPDGVYTFGEIGIGTCLAGPADLAFVEEGGKTWLAIANADPYVSFTSGSVELVDIASIDESTGRNLMSDLDAHAVQTDRFVGGLGYVADRGLLLAADRFTPDAIGTTGRDALLVFDVSDPTNPQPWSEGASLTLEDDPQPVVVDPAAGRAYVENLTDHSISVVDTTSTPLDVVDVAPDADVSAGTFVEADETGTSLGDPPGGSTADFDDPEVLTAEDVQTDQWTLTWVDGQYRLWTPEGDGLVRYTTGGLDYVRSGVGAEIDASQSGGTLTEVRDPFAGLVEGELTMYLASEGSVRQLYYDDASQSWSYATASQILLSGRDGAWDAAIGGPVVLTVGDLIDLFYEGRDGTIGALPKGIGRATTTGGTFGRSGNDPVVAVPDGYDAVGDPYVRNDPMTDTQRMWVSLHDGSRWSIGYTESADQGATWSAVSEVLAADDGGDLAAPVVTWANGRYLLWASHHTAAGDVAFASAWSWDGLDWHDLKDAIAATDATWDDADPPRLALQSAPSGEWRLEGENAGAQTIPVVAGTTDEVDGLGLRAVGGFDVGDDAFGDQGANGVVPGSWLDVDGVPTLYLTITDTEGREHVAAVQQLSGSDWAVVGDELVPDGEGGNDAGASDPVVVATDAGYTMYYAAHGADGVTRIRRATSADGLSFSPEGDPLVASGQGWDSIAQLPHSLEDLGDGTVRLWYGGSNGSRFRIGSATSTDGGLTFTADTGTDVGWQVGTGLPGEFDDSGVRDPVVLVQGDVRHLWYSAFDGATWTIGHATQPVDGGEWVRRTDPVTGEPVPVLIGAPDTFSTGGVLSPVLQSATDGDYVLWYAGYDGPDPNTLVEPRAGLAEGSADQLYAHQRFPTAGDRIEFTSTRGSTGRTGIDLATTVDGFATSGIGVSGMTLDAERGFLYVPSKLANYIYVIDVRDDSDPSWTDANYLDVEAILTVTTTTGPKGFRDVRPIPGTPYVYATSLGPDAVFVLDMTDVIDDASAEIYPQTAVGALPGAWSAEDAGPPSYVGTTSSTPELGYGVMAYDEANHLLWVPHFMDDSVSVFDLSRGQWGEEVARADFIGEGPWLVRLSPDGTRAFVANYTGEVDNGLAESTIAVMDADPASPTFGQVLTWLANR